MITLTTPNAEKLFSMSHFSVDLYNFLSFLDFDNGTPKAFLLKFCILDNSKRSACMARMMCRVFFDAQRHSGQIV